VEKFSDELEDDLLSEEEAVFKENESVNDLWLISYADLLTLLFGFFAMLFFETLSPNSPPKAGQPAIPKVSSPKTHLGSGDSKIPAPKIDNYNTIVTPSIEQDVSLRPSENNNVTAFEKSKSPSDSLQSNNSKSNSSANDGPSSIQSFLVSFPEGLIFACFVFGVIYLILFLFGKNRLRTMMIGPRLPDLSKQHAKTNLGHAAFRNHLEEFDSIAQSQDDTDLTLSVDEKWLISYADLMMLLFGFFAMLYLMKENFRNVENSINSSFTGSSNSSPTTPTSSNELAKTDTETVVKDLQSTKSVETKETIPESLTPLEIVGNPVQESAKKSEEATTDSADLSDPKSIEQMQTDLIDEFSKKWEEEALNKNRQSTPAISNTKIAEAPSSESVKNESSMDASPDLTINKPSGNSESTASNLGSGSSNGEGEGTGEGGFAPQGYLLVCNAPVCRKRSDYLCMEINPATGDCSCLDQKANEIYTRGFSETEKPFGNQTSYGCTEWQEALKARMTDSRNTKYPRLLHITHDSANTLNPNGNLVVANSETILVFRPEEKTCAKKAEVGSPNLRKSISLSPVVSTLLNIGRHQKGQKIQVSVTGCQNEVNSIVLYVK
jgi:flagellar motor protein MotB